MHEEFRVTESWLREVGASDRELENFRKYGSGGSCSILEFLKLCEKPELSFLGYMEVKDLPKNPTPLVLEQYSGGDIFYNGDVHIKKGFDCDGVIACRNLTVDGTLTLDKGMIGVRKLSVQVFNHTCDMLCRFNAEGVNADEINVSADIKNSGMFQVLELNARVINIQGPSLVRVIGKIKAEEITLSTWSNIYADEICAALINLRRANIIYANKINANEVIIGPGNTHIFVHCEIDAVIKNKDCGVIKLVEHPFDLRQGMLTYLTSADLEGTVWEPI